MWNGEGGGVASVRISPKLLGGGGLSQIIGNVGGLCMYACCCAEYNMLGSCFVMYVLLWKIYSLKHFFYCLSIFVCLPVCLFVCLSLSSD